MSPLPNPPGVFVQRIRRFCRTLLLAFGFLLTVGSTRAEFTLRLQPGDPGTLSLQFTLAPGYYYSLESSADLLTGYTQASGWMLGNDNIGPVSWPIHYPTSPSSGGGTPVGSTDTFALYPFPENKTLVTWEDASATRYRALIGEDYTSLPPLLTVPATATSGSLLLLVGKIAWNEAYDDLSETLLPPAQLPTLGCD